ncbi:MAG: Tetratricopeptide 2 repeat protein, partial [bacterium]|nr:Tetratricopeptide 2 repeat protein [bacterium]
MRLVAVALIVLAVSPPTARADWEIKRSPFDARVVARYKQILHRDPEDADALAKLTALYKQHKSVEELRRELTTAAEKSHDAADWLVAGHAARARGDFAAAVKAYVAALAAAPDDARAQVALADADVR